MSKIKVSKNELISEISVITGYTKHDINIIQNFGKNRLIFVFGFRIMRLNSMTEMSNSGKRMQASA